MSDRTVRAATKTDIPAMGEALGRAFFDDPVFNWLLPNEQRRAGRIARFFRAQTKYAHLPKGGCDVLTEDGAVLGAALWDPPNQWRTSVMQEVRGAPAHVRALGGRIVSALAAEQRMQRNHPSEPHWYLAILGTEPAAQGTGVGGNLLNARLSQCDATGMPAYLESSKESNIPYYERFGFRLTGEFTLGKGSPPLWPMWRDPAG